jgi:DNA-damage-inducible protein D
MPSESDFDLFHFEAGKRSFEDIAGNNGFRFWLASDLMNCIGYATIKSMKSAINRAMAACAQLNVPILENFIETPSGDWKLSRFACYLTVMNADPKKAQVAKAQAYFIVMADALRNYVHQAENVDRINVRADLSDREMSLSGTVANRDINSYALFRNAGYRGMYNLDLWQIRSRKGVPDGRSPLDFMGKAELAANLFRLTQTEERIRNDDIHGQSRLERVATEVGRAVRKTMIETGGTAPENLPPAEDLKEIKRDLKKQRKEFVKLDSSKNAKARKIDVSRESD